MPTATATARDAGAALVAWAEEQIGKPYRYGGVGPSSYDCSGLVQAAAHAAGLTTPRVSSEQFTSTTRISQGDLQPGDLVFSEWPGDDVAHHGHVAIYAGDGMIIEAPHTGAYVQKVPLDQSYLAHVDGFGRISGVPTAAGATSTATATPAGFDIGGLIGSLLGGPGGAMLGTGGNITGLGDFFGKLYDITVAVFNFWMAFFKPSTYIRIAAGIAGFVFAIVGIVFLAREAKTA